MVRAWYMDTEKGSQKAPHMTEPPQYVSLDKLAEMTGVEYFKVCVNTLGVVEQYIIMVNHIRLDRLDQVSRLLPCSTLHVHTCSCCMIASPIYTYY